MAERIIRKASEYITFDELYKYLEKSDWNIKKVFGKNYDENIPEIDYLLEYFEAEEEYEKCAKLRELKNTLK